MGKLVYGVGINDAGYVTQPSVNGVVVVCPYYQKWKSMLARCYSEKFHIECPTYVGCEVCEEWKTFSNFKAWMMEQDWKGKQLDKDILIPDNKIYSSITSVFVNKNVNVLLVDCASSRGEYLIGVSWQPQRKKFQAKCNDGSGRTVSLGRFDTELEAHLAWKAYKHKLACKLADEQSDPRVAEALRSRFV